MVIYIITNKNFIILLKSQKPVTIKYCNIKMFDDMKIKLYLSIKNIYYTNIIKRIICIIFLHLSLAYLKSHNFMRYNFNKLIKVSIKHKYNILNYVLGMK